MPDISMCKDINCPLRHRCDRFMATPDKYQWYAGFKFDNGCDYFLGKD